jgi:hypothetical protein
MDIFAVIILLVFAQAAGNPQIPQGAPQNPQGVATRKWLDKQTQGASDQAAMEEAARRAAAEAKRDLRDRWQDFAAKANACAQSLDTDAPDRRACARADKAWQRLVGSEAWPADYAK